MNNNTNSYEAANPVFNTAKMTSFFLAESGNKYAKKIIERTGFDEQLAYSSNPAMAAVIKPNMVGQNIRYEAVNLLVRKAGNRNILDIACGFSPRGLELSKEGYRYVGGDLQMVVPVISPLIKDLAEESSELIDYQVVDATNLESCLAATKNFDGPVTVVTEGLMPYLNSSEKKLLFENIAAILRKYGGCYICPDFNDNSLALEMSKVIIGEKALEAVLKTQAEFSNKGDSNTHENMLKPLDEAKQIMKETNLVPEILPLYPLDEEFPSIELVEDSKREELREVVSRGVILVAQIDKDIKSEVKESVREGKDFKIERSIEGGIINFILSGRMDSLTSPLVVDSYREVDKSCSYEAVVFDMKDLLYISSAGLRVIMMIRKDDANRPVRLKNVSEGVAEIFETTGFCSIVEIM